MNIFYVDGEFVPADKAVIPVDDLAILRGFGVFDLLRTYHGKPFFLDEHVDRLESSARKVELTLPWSHDEIVAIVLKTLQKNDLAETNVRIVVTGGSSPDYMTPQGNPRLLVLVSPIPQLPAWWYTKGVKIITILSERNIPGAKSIDYIPATIALRKAKAQDAIEAVYYDRDDFVLEGTTSNLFIMLDGTLVTPGRDILSGITRKVVLDIAKDRLPIEIRDISRRELLEAQEVFISGTNKGVVPVIQVDDTVIAAGTPGQATREIMAVLERKIEAHDNNHR